MNNEDVDFILLFILVVTNIGRSRGISKSSLKKWEEFIFEWNMKYVKILDICVTVQDRIFLRLFFRYFPNSILIWVHPKSVFLSILILHNSICIQK